MGMCVPSSAAQPAPAGYLAPMFLAGVLWRIQWCEPSPMLPMFKSWEEGCPASSVSLNCEHWEVENCCDAVPSNHSSNVSCTLALKAPCRRGILRGQFRAASSLVHIATAPQHTQDRVLRLRHKPCQRELCVNECTVLVLTADAQLESQCSRDCPTHSRMTLNQNPVRFC